MNPLFEVVRNPDRCIKCRVCERQCANEVHRYDEERGGMILYEEERNSTNTQNYLEKSEDMLYNKK